MSNPRWVLERAVLASELPPPARHVLLTLAVFADWPAGTTPAQHTPSLSKLSRSTGLSRSTVADHLNKLEAAGWVRRLRPTNERARSDKERTRYRLTVPGASPGDGLVRDTDQSASPGDGLAGPGDGPELVREADGASPGDGHIPDLPQTTQTEELPMAPSRRRGARVPDDFAVTPAMRAWYRDHAPDVDIAIETAQFLDHYRAATGAKAVKADWVAAWRTWMRNAQKWKTERATNGRSNGHAAAIANRHVDQLTAAQREARNPFTNAVRASQTSQGGTP